MPQFSADTVVQRAQTLTDVEDPDPTHFAENLAAVVECMSGEKELTLAGVEMAVGMLALALRNRMEVDRYVADQPAVENASVDRPIFLTGLPRSGTTYFQYLFDLDPDLRMMRTWEGERPVPPPAVDADSARRRREASIENAWLDSRITGGKIDAFHLTDVDGPQECLAILDQTFVNPGLLWPMSGERYLEYLLHGADLRAAYEYHARVLKLLQSGAPPKRWTLKWPCHLLALEAIAEVYPDATFVVTHRDPVQALASNCSLAHMLRTGTDPNYDPTIIGRDMLNLVRAHVDRLVAFDVAQSQSEGSSLVHVDYYRLVDSPETVMPSVFESVGLEWTPVVEDRIRAWRAENPKGKRGTHEYTLDDYGLDRAMVSEALAAYVERFNIPSEYGSS